MSTSLPLARQKSVASTEDVSVVPVPVLTTRLSVLEALDTALVWQAHNNVSPSVRHAIDAAVAKFAGGQTPFHPRHAQEVLQCAIASSGDGTEVTVALLDALLRSMAVTIAASSGTPAPVVTPTITTETSGKATPTATDQNVEFSLLIGALALSNAWNGSVSETVSGFCSLVATPCPMTFEDTIRALWDACVVMPPKASASLDYVVTLTVANAHLALRRLTNAIVLQDVTRLFKSAPRTKVHPHTDLLAYIDAVQAEGKDAGTALYLYGSMALWSHFGNVLGHVTSHNIETVVFAFVKSYGRPVRQRRIRAIPPPVTDADASDTADLADLNAGYDTKDLPDDKSHFNRTYKFDDAAFPDNPSFRLAIPSTHHSALLPVGPNICTLRKHQPASGQDEIQAALCIAALLGVGMDINFESDGGAVADGEDDEDKKPDDDRFTAVLAHARAQIRRVVHAASITLEPDRSVAKKARIATTVEDLA